jgi:insulysin
VLQLVLGAIAGLRNEGIPRHVFQEARTMADIDLRYSPRPESADEARRLAAMMQDYPLASLPDGPLRYETFAPALYRQVLNALRPDNMLVTLVAQGVPTQFTEPYYGTAYGYREVGGDVYAVLTRAEPDPRWAPPRPNPFIPRETAVHGPTGPLKLSAAALLRLAQNGTAPAVLERLSPLAGRSYTSPQAAVADLAGALPRSLRATAQREVLENSLPLPRKLLDDDRGLVWYAPSLRFREPRAQIDLRIFVAEAAADARQAALGALYVRSLEESLNEMAYPIRQAGLDFGLGWGVSGLNLMLSGYSDRMLYLLDTLFSGLQRVDLSEARFAALQEQMLRRLRSAQFDVPYRQARYFNGRLWREPSLPREAIADAVAGLTLADVRRFAGTAFERTYLEGTVVGNLPADAVQETLLQAHAKLGSTPLPAAGQVRERIRSLPRGVDYRFVEALPVGNSLIDVFYEAGQTEPRLRGALLLAGRPLKDAFYLDMRTRQQLGYIVYAGFDQMKQTLGLVFLVQSGTYAPDALQRRMDAFVPGFIEQLRAMPPAQFEQYRKAVIDAKLEPPGSLAEEARRLNWVAFEHGAQFDHVSADIAAVQALEPAYVTDVVQQVLAGPGRRRLGIWLVGQGHTVTSRSGRLVTPESMSRLAPAAATAAGG